MKKLILTAVTVLAVMGGFGAPAYAEGLLGGNLNLQGDTMYLPKHGQFALGVGTTIASLDKDGIVSIRGEVATTVGGETHTLVGGGIGVNIPKLVEKLGGSWILKAFTVDIFTAVMMDMSASKFTAEPIIGVSILKVNF